MDRGGRKVFRRNSPDPTVTHFCDITCLTDIGSYSLGGGGATEQPPLWGECQEAEREL